MSRNDERIGAQFRQLGSNARALVFCLLAGEAQVVERNGTERRGRAIGPDLVDQVGFDCRQGGARRGAGFAHALGAFHRVQPGIVAQPIAAREVVLDPPMRRVLDQMLDREQRGIHLLADLEGVASIDEKHRAIEEHDRRAGRTGEAGQPGEPFLAGRQIFILVTVGARHDKAGQMASRELGAQRGKARRACGALR